MTSKGGCVTLALNKDVYGMVPLSRLLNAQIIRENIQYITLHINPNNTHHVKQWYLYCTTPLLDRAIGLRTAVVLTSAKSLLKHKHD